VRDGANRTVVVNVLADLSRGHTGRNSLVICAHYDSRAEDRGDLAPGADDNASGVAVLLETARVLAQAGIEPRVTLAFFGGEEDSLLGSSAFVEELLSEHLPLRGVINVDMVGYDEYGPQDIVVFTNPQSVPLALEVIETAVVSAVRDIGREPAAFLVSEPARVGRRPNGGGAVL
jgi:Zn-dependent M28 family amino/carboxypeptidase